jgi:hypothetical protein
MAPSAILLLAVLLPMLLAAAFLLGRYFHRRHDARSALSPVTRQHIDLFAGGELSAAAVESAKNRFRHLLERGEWRAVEASLRPGIHYVVNVRALAEIGTEAAGRILERQLQVRLTKDLMEQSWYWIDLAHGLRSLNREQSLPELLRCAEAHDEHPLAHFFAAETICFLSFAGYLRRPDSPLGQAALRVLYQALVGLRCGLAPQVVTEARLGELIEELWDHRPDSINPLAVRVFLEALRVLRRAPHAEVVLANEEDEQEAFGWQMGRMAALEPVLTVYLEEASRSLCAALANAGSGQQREILCALEDLRAETAGAVLPLLADAGFAQAELAVNTLTWSRDPRVAPWLRAWALRRVPIAERTRRRRLARGSRRFPIPADLPYHAILRALRGHPCAETEAFLLLASQDVDPRFRAAALGSLGWWEPIHRDRVDSCLQAGRQDPRLGVRQAARAALARLGERPALSWFRQALTSRDPQRVHEAIQAVADEGLVLLWPDLDHLSDTENLNVALHACEALERLREGMNLRPV